MDATPQLQYWSHQGAPTNGGSVSSKEGGGSCYQAQKLRKKGVAYVWEQICPRIQRGKAGLGGANGASAHRQREVLSVASVSPPPAAAERIVAKPSVGMPAFAVASGLKLWLEKELGKGYSGAVYQVKSLCETDKEPTWVRCALKVSSFRCQSEESIAMSPAAREFETMSFLYRKGVPVPRPLAFEVERAGRSTRTYMLMELMDGPNLRDWISSQPYYFKDAEAGRTVHPPLTVKQAIQRLDLALLLLESLRKLHAHGNFVDLKPRNIMITGCPVLDLDSTAPSPVSPSSSTAKTVLVDAGGIVLRSRLRTEESCAESADPGQRILKRNSTVWNEKSLNSPLTKNRAPDSSEKCCSDEDMELTASAHRYLLEATCSYLTPEAAAIILESDRSRNQIEMRFPKTMIDLAKAQQEAVLARLRSPHDKIAVEKGSANPETPESLERKALELAYEEALRKMMLSGVVAVAPNEEEAEEQCFRDESITRSTNSELMTTPCTSEGAVSPTLLAERGLSMLSTVASVSDPEGSLTSPRGSVCDCGCGTVPTSLRALSKGFSNSGGGFGERGEGTALTAAGLPDHLKGCSNGRTEVQRLSSSKGLQQPGIAERESIEAKYLVSGSCEASGFLENSRNGICECAILRPDRRERRDRQECGSECADEQERPIPNERISCGSGQEPLGGPCTQTERYSTVGYCPKIASEQPLSKGNFSVCLDSKGGTGSWKKVTGDCSSSVSPPQQLRSGTRGSFFGLPDARKQLLSRTCRKGRRIGQLACINGDCHAHCRPILRRAHLEKPFAQSLFMRLGQKSTVFGLGLLLVELFGGRRTGLTALLHDPVVTRWFNGVRPADAEFRIVSEWNTPQIPGQMFIPHGQSVLRSMNIGVNSLLSKSPKNSAASGKVAKVLPDKLGLVYPPNFRLEVQVAERHSLPPKSRQQHLREQATTGDQRSTSQAQHPQIQQLQLWPPGCPRGSADEFYQFMHQLVMRDHAEGGKSVVSKWCNDLYKVELAVRARTKPMYSFFDVFKGRCYPKYGVFSTVPGLGSTTLMTKLMDSVLNSCFEFAPMARPSFAQLENTLQSMRLLLSSAEHGFLGLSMFDGCGTVDVRIQEDGLVAVYGFMDTEAPSKKTIDCRAAFLHEAGACSCEFDEADSTWSRGTLLGSGRFLPDCGCFTERQISECSDQEHLADVEVRVLVRRDCCSEEGLRNRYGRFSVERDCYWWHRAPTHGTACHAKQPARLDAKGYKYESLELEVRQGEEAPRRWSLTL